jgi:nicotinate-nucleotide pyrophosphorylase (carboxylating)
VGSEGSLFPTDIPDQVRRALAEDIGTGDVTALMIPPDTLARAKLITREPMVVCGTAWFDETFRQLDARVVVDWRTAEGDLVPAGSVLCELRGSARAMLTGERTAMNFLQTLSGTATLTRRYADAVAGTGCQVLDTRKTLPGLRDAQKYAVRCGGGRNHRMGLYDMVLIKENHIVAAGSVEAALARARAVAPGVPVEIEVETLDEFAAALAARPDIIMLDEFTDGDMRSAVQMNKAAGEPVRLEASGGVDLESLRRVAATGVNYISIGSLTKHLRAIDLSMRFQLAEPAR